MPTTTLFSWGYWGWGNATPRLLEAVDAAEAARGFAPPVFVDARISRSVRAVGFRDHAFRDLLGPERYVWMRSLGNRSVETRSGPRIQIADPGAALELLDRAVALEAERRRVLFFCSCERPIDDQGGDCHRVTVATLVREAAAARAIPVETVEWPGGLPRVLDLEVPLSTLRAVRRGRASLPLPEPLQLRRFAGLAWGSLVRLHAPGAELVAVTGPAKFQGGAFCLPMLRPFDGANADAAATAWAADYRRTHGYEAAATAGALDEPSGRPRAFASSCVYTIAHVDRLRAAHDGGGDGLFQEKRAWTTGKALLAQAKEEGVELPILFADAADCTKLLYAAAIRAITVTGDGTTYAFERLRPVPAGHAPQELVLLKTGEPIGPGFIRPYALCRTPTFLRHP